MSYRPESEYQREWREEAHAAMRDALQEAADHLAHGTATPADLALVLDTLKDHELIDDDRPLGWAYADTSTEDDDAPAF